MNGGSIALFNTDAMKWKTTAMPMLYICMVEQRYGYYFWMLIYRGPQMPGTAG